MLSELRAVSRVYIIFFLYCCCCCRNRTRRIVIFQRCQGKCIIITNDFSSKTQPTIYYVVPYDGNYFLSLSTVEKGLFVCMCLCDENSVALFVKKFNYFFFLYFSLLKPMIPCCGERQQFYMEVKF